MPQGESSTKFLVLIYQWPADIYARAESPHLFFHYPEFKVLTYSTVDLRANHRDLIDLQTYLHTYIALSFTIFR